MSETEVFRVCFVCSGNICRSPMAEVVFRALAEKAGLRSRFEATSRGIGGWHEGDPADRRTLLALSETGYDGGEHRAHEIAESDVLESDLLVALDRGHERFMLDRGADRDRVTLLTAFDPELPDDPDVFDPYHSDQRAFAEVLAQVERSCVRLLEHLRERPGI